MGAPTTTEQGASIEVDSVSLAYAGGKAGAGAPRTTGTLAVSDVSFSARPGEVVVVLGPSGCGKSTLLKVIAGLLAPSRGSVRIDGTAQADRRVGFVFQSDALLPWRTAVQNVKLAVQLAGKSRQEAGVQAHQLMEELGLGDSCDKYPSQLSGGMRKRVALARALAYDPSVFLMDEPFGALDAQTRIRVGNFLLRILDRFGQTVIFVTHDIDEAIVLADRIIVMSASPGRIAATIDVSLPKPRDYYESRLTDGFTAMQKRVWEMMS
jgi:NitT/TauT family transport system ATP-binding protein